ncbi:MAG: hypothetical protein JRN39_02670 [Nitrososphaerota archaeon]|nr:hypothetical protein [Nitrososphaerota archaeon]
MLLFSVQLIAVAATLVSGSVIFLKILIDPSSPFLKRRHVETARYSVLLGIPLGLVFPLLSQYDEYALLGFTLALLSFTVYYYMLRRSPSSFYRFRLGWVSRETVRSRFLHLAVASGVACFVDLFFWLNIFEVPFGSPVPPTVPVMLAMVSSISGLFALTSFVPKLDILYCLVDDFTQNSYHPRPGMWIEIEDTDFPSIIAGTAFTSMEMVDAFESLRKEGYLERQPHPIMGRVRYRIFPEGMVFLDTSAQDVRGRIDAAMRQIDISADAINGHVNGARPLESRSLDGATKELQTLRSKIQRLKEEYGRLVPVEWEASSLAKIHQLELGVRDQGGEPALVEA